MSSFLFENEDIDLNVEFDVPSEIGNVFLDVSYGAIGVMGEGSPIIYVLDQSNLNSQTIHYGINLGTGAVVETQVLDKELRPDAGLSAGHCYKLPYSRRYKAWFGSEDTSASSEIFMVSSEDGTVVDTLGKAYDSTPETTTDPDEFAVSGLMTILGPDTGQQYLLMAPATQCKWTSVPFDENGFDAANVSTLLRPELNNGLGGNQLGSARINAADFINLSLYETLHICVYDPNASATYDTRLYLTTFAVDPADNQLSVTSQTFFEYEDIFDNMTVVTGLTLVSVHELTGPDRLFAVLNCQISSPDPSPSNDATVMAVFDRDGASWELVDSYRIAFDGNSHSSPKLSNSLSYITPQRFPLHLPGESSGSNDSFYLIDPTEKANTFEVDYNPPGTPGPGDPVDIGQLSTRSCVPWLGQTSQEEFLTQVNTGTPAGDYVFGDDWLVTFFFGQFFTGVPLEEGDRTPRLPDPAYRLRFGNYTGVLNTLGTFLETELAKYTDEATASSRGGVLDLNGQRVRNVGTGVLNFDGVNYGQVKTALGIS